MASTTLAADIKAETVEYTSGGQTFEGFVAWDAQLADHVVPGVLVVHQWMGLTDYEKNRCKMLAELGFVAFAVDVYGKGVRPNDVQSAVKLSGSFKSDRELYRNRLTVGLEQLRKRREVAKDDIAAIGYCFGGTGVLELARSGADIDAVISFHGGLDSVTPADAKNIKSHILICHGADDPFVPYSDIEAMKQEFNAANVDWQMNVYSHAVHSFTQPMAGDDNSRGAAYNPLADKRSWEAMQDFLHESFQPAQNVN